MKKRVIAGTAAVLAAAAALGSCDLNDSDAQCVYGPPEYFEARNTANEAAPAENTADTAENNVAKE